MMLITKDKNDCFHYIVWFFNGLYIYNEFIYNGLGRTRSSLLSISQNNQNNQPKGKCFNNIGFLTKYYNNSTFDKDQIQLIHILGEILFSDIL